MDVRRAVLILAVLLAASTTSAQQLAPPSRAGGNRIDLDVVVARKSGTPVSGLQQQDFTLLDNKVPQTITSFQALDGTQTPIQVVIVIDAVNAPYRAIAYERDQIDSSARTRERFATRRLFSSLPIRAWRRWRTFQKTVTN
jgi:hypothetical protein